MKLSKYKGVTWNRRADKYVAYIRVNGKQVTLGYFNSEEEANNMVQKHSLVRKQVIQEIEDWAKENTESVENQSGDRGGAIWTSELLNKLQTLKP